VFKKTLKDCSKSQWIDKKRLDELAPWGETNS
jgi:hypothetical protein